MNFSNEVLYSIINIIIIQKCCLAKRGGFCGVVGPRLSVNKNLEKVFEQYVDQVKQSDSEHHKKEEEKHGTDYKPQTKPFQLGDEGIFDFDGEEKEIREDIFKECLENLIKQDSRFGNFEKKILYLDCNNLYGKLILIIPRITSYFRILSNYGITLKRF